MAGNVNSGRKAPSIIGKKFGRWTVIEHAGGGEYLVHCDCGKKGRYVMRSMLTMGKSKSCGCLRREQTKKNQVLKKKITYTSRGVTKTIQEWAKETGISVQTIKARLKANWEEEYIFIPVNKGRKK